MTAVRGAVRASAGSPPPCRAIECAPVARAGDKVRRTVKLRVLDPRIGREFPLPQHATAGSAGMDLRACLAAPLLLAPGAAELIPTGISIYIADTDLAA